MPTWREARVWASGAVCALLAASLAHAGTDPTPQRSTLTILEQARSLPASGVSHAIVEVTNQGSSTWPARGAVRLSYRWLDGTGRTVEHDAREAALTRDVAPGSTLRVCAALAVPATAGRYAIKWDLVEDAASWFSDRELTSPAVQLVDVGEARGPDARRSTTLFAWLLVNLLHIAAATWVACRLAGRSMRASAEETLFTAVLVALGGLLAVLAVVSMTVGLSLTNAAIALCLADAALILGLATWSPSSGVAHGARAAAADRFERAAQWLGAAVILAVAIHWVAAAAAVSRVTGVDAGHYHVPHAVNFALGASPLGLLATPHLYPAGTSLLAAWFLLPLGNPLIVDLAVLPGFLLLFASLAWIFRVATGYSGLAWTPWLALLLFSTPLWRMSSLMSADLAYAAAFVALFAQLFALRSRGVLTRLDLARAAVACGLLFGSKVTGLPSAMCLLALLVGSAVVRPIRVSERATSGRAWTTSVAVAVLLVLLTGGFWLARNWVNYGTPVAPMGVRVLGYTLAPGPGAGDARLLPSSARRDLRDQSDRAVGIVGMYLAKWLGGLYLPSLLGLLIVPLERVWARVRAGPGAREASARRLLWWSVMAVSAAVLWWTAGLPWTSLTATEGMSLRFVLPVLALLPLASLVGGFSPTMSWHGRADSRSLVLALFIVVSLGTFVHRQATVWVHDPEGRPGLDVPSVTASALIVGGWMASRRVRRRSVTVAVGVALLLASAAAGARTLAARDWVTNSADRAELDRLDACVARDVDTDADHFRRVLLVARESEPAGSAGCARRRFFVGARFDHPLALQPVEYTSLVFDARRPGVDFFDGGEQLRRGARFVEGALEAARPGNMPGICDYVVLDRDSKPPLASGVMTRLLESGRLRLVGRSGRFDVYVAGPD